MTHTNTVTPETAAGAAQPANGQASAAPAPSPVVQAGPAAPAAGANEQPERSSIERAEALADRFSTQVAVVTSVVGHGLLRFLSRMREEAEDLWAEAQSIRRGDKS
jgi:hypothetical protein